MSIYTEDAIRAGLKYMEHSAHYQKNTNSIDYLLLVRNINAMYEVKAKEAMKCLSVKILSTSCM